MSSRDRLPIAGIGASAGGLEALEALFRNLPTDTGMAFVVVTHQPPDRVSRLPEILARYTAMPVAEASQNVVIKPDHVYVGPPDRVMSVKGGYLRLRPPEPHLRHFPIDQLLMSLAEEYRDAALGVLLSGGGTDGTLGLRAIKDAGGFTFAQGGNGSEPQQTGMPDSALAAGVVDLVLPVETIGERLTAIAHDVPLPEAPPEGAAETPPKAKDARSGNGATGEALDVISGIVLDRLGHDFSGYKPKTFLRRVQRRMQVLQCSTLTDYIARLREDDEEVSRLFRDLLIGVSGFFRDSAAFEVLESEVIPRLFEHKGSDNSLRVWVPGCATGEEAYSIAILLREAMGERRNGPPVQIFATDIDEAALDMARAGRYPAAALANIRTDRLQRFFTGHEGYYTISKQIRGMCVFSSHNVLQDPPFSRLDLVSCRNLLIYFSAELQARVLPLFHFALKPGGYLFLGASENVSQRPDLFWDLSARSRIYRRRDGPAVPLAFRQGKLSGTTAHGGAAPAKGGKSGVRDLRSRIESQVLERFAPAHVLVNRDGEVLYYSAHTGKYLEIAPGLPTRQLLATARKGLRLPLRSLLREALETRRRAERNRLSFELDGRVQTIDLLIEPFGQSDEDPLFLVVFHDLGEPVEAGAPQSEGEKTDTAIEHVEEELRETRERLQVTVEEYETAVEELKSSNQELQSINEELQSTNEELETSKEESQSVNEELNTVNAELHSKVEELDRANADLHNVFESTDLAIVFLDRQLAIRTFTPAATRIFKLIASDEGRPLTDISNTLAQPGDLTRDVQAVFEQGAPIERRVGDRDGRTWYLMRILPYREDSGDTDGALIVFADVTQLVESEARQRDVLERLNARIRGLLADIARISEAAPAAEWSGEQFREAFVGRLHSMAACYELLAKAGWGEVDLAEIAEGEFGRYQLGTGTPRVAMEGPALRFSAPQALSLGMVLHELVDDAARRGVLSSTEERLALKWRTLRRKGRDPVVEIEWQETNRASGRRLQQKSFGQDLVRHEVETALHGTVQFVRGRTGLRVRLSIPLVIQDGAVTEDAGQESGGQEDAGQEDAGQEDAGQENSGRKGVAAAAR